MELHPILEKDTCPNPKLWYVLSCVGDSPTARVGHTCTFIPGPENSDGKVYVIGGANPSGSFSDVYVLDLATFSWDTVDAPGFKARYEHAAFVPKSQPNKIYIFGGADQSGNQNDLQVLDTVSKTWSTLRPTGAAPSPRTYHTTACAGDRFVVYSGGHQGSDPVGDRQVHSFDAVTCTWSTLTVRGDSPKPRHGHITQAVGSKIYVHGGMAGPTFYDDLHVLDPDSLTWRSVKQKRGRPAARAAHGSCVHGSCLLIFGGMNREGALDDAWSLNTKTHTWSQVELDGPAPACRLDFAMCSVSLRVAPSGGAGDAGDVSAARDQAKETLDEELRRMGSAGSGRSAGSASSTGSQRSVASAGSQPRDEKVPSDPSSPVQGSPVHEPSATGASSSPGVGAAATAPEVASVTAEGGASAADVKHVTICVVMGGMDTEGEIFDDCLVMLVDEK